MAAAQPATTIQTAVTASRRDATPLIMRGRLDNIDTPRHLELEGLIGHADVLLQIREGKARGPTLRIDGDEPPDRQARRIDDQAVTRIGGAAKAVDADEIGPGRQAAERNLLAVGRAVGQAQAIITLNDSRVSD